MSQFMVLYLKSSSSLQLFFDDKFNFNFYKINKEEIKLGIVILMFLMLIHILCLNLLKIEIIGFGDLKLLFIFNLFIGFNNVLIILFISSSTLKAMLDKILFFVNFNNSRLLLKRLIFVIC